MTPRAPPTKNSSFCSTEGAGAQPGPGSVAAACGAGRAWWRLRDPLSAAGYRAGAAAATGKCQAGAPLPVGWAGGSGLRRVGGLSLLSTAAGRVERGRGACCVRAGPEPVGREGCVCMGPPSKRGALRPPRTGRGRKGDGDIPGAGSAA